MTAMRTAQAPSRLRSWTTWVVADKALAAAFGIAFSAAAAIAMLGTPRGWIFCWTNCGELFDAMLYVSNFHLYGFRFGLVQDMATSPAIAAHPFLYTHNPNIAGMLFVLLDVLNVASLQGKQIVTLGIFVCGLLYVFGAVRLYTRSAVTALIALTLFVIDVEHVTSFALNPLRVWHWVALFGTLFHVGKLALPRSNRLLHWLSIGVLAFAALGVGYDFWIVCLATSAIAILCPGGPRGSSAFAVLRRIAALFAIPVVCRQVQVASVIGFDLWLIDLGLSAVIKIPVLAGIFEPPSAEVIDAMYARWNILRPPASPPESVLSLIRTLRDMFVAVVVPSYGLLALLLVAVVLSSAIVIAWRLGRERKGAAHSGIPASAGNAQEVGMGMHTLVLALTGGALFGLLFFAPLSFHIYIKHGFPLLAGPILVCKAVAFSHAIAWFFRGRRLHRPLLRGIAACLLGLLVWDTAAVNILNLRALHPIDTSWIELVANMKGQTFAVSWIPNAVSVFSANWAVGIKPGRERVVVDRLARGEDPFTRDDLLLFGERDASARIAEYLHPAYWLYFPTDQNTQFDHPTPTCRSDWILGMLRWSSEPRGGMPQIRRAALDPPVANPGDSITVSATVTEVQSADERFELRHDGWAALPLQFNCIYGALTAEFTVPSNATMGTHQLEFWRVASWGHVGRIGSIDLVVDHTAPRRKTVAKSTSVPQPSVSLLVSSVPDALVAAAGRDYMLLDLRHIVATTNR